MHISMVIEKREIEPFLNRFKNVIETQGFLPYNERTGQVIQYQFVLQACYDVFCQYLLHYYTGVQCGFNPIDAIGEYFIDRGYEPKDLPFYCYDDVSCPTDPERFEAENHDYSNVEFLNRSLVELLEQVRYNTNDWFRMIDQKIQQELLDLVDIHADISSIRGSAVFYFEVENIDNHWNS